MIICYSFQDYCYDEFIHFSCGSVLQRRPSDARAGPRMLICTKKQRAQSKPSSRGIPVYHEIRNKSILNVPYLAE